MTHTKRPNHSSSYILKGLLAGALGGPAGTCAMNHAQRLWTIAADGDAPESAGDEHDARDWQERSEGKNANELAARRVATAVIGRHLTRDELRITAPALHHGFGAAMGALYGVYAEHVRDHRSASGMGFGTALWAGADEIAMPEGCRNWDPEPFASCTPQIL